MQTISAFGLAKNFGKKSVLLDINFHVSRGDRIGIIGPNGSGKTTLLKILSGISSPSTGNVFVNHQIKSEKISPHRKKIGFITQEDSLDQTLNVFENLVYYGRYTGMNKAHALAAADQLLESMGLSSLKNSNVNKLSSGTKKKISILRCLINSPNFVFMDEPANHLDVQSKAWLNNLIKERPEKGFVLSSHHIDDIDSICNYVIILYEGKILAEGVPRNLIASHIESYVLEFYPNSEAIEETKKMVVSFKHVLDNGTYRLFSNDKNELIDISSKVSSSSITLRQSSLKDLYIKIINQQKGQLD